MIHVVAVITAHPGQRDALVAAFEENVPNVLAEDGCEQYTGVVDADGIGSFQAPVGADTLVVIEKWRDAAALEAHGAAPHMAAFGAKVKAIVADRKIHVLSEV